MTSRNTGGLARSVTAAAIIFLVGVWGAWNQAQVVVLAMAVIALCLLYKTITLRFVRSALGFGDRLTGAKWKDLELTAEEKKRALEYQVQVEGNLAVLLSDLDANAYGMLYRVRQEGSLPLTTANRARATFLRDRGLLVHDQPRLRDSTSVTLSALGIDIMDRLEAKATKDSMPSEDSHDGEDA